MRLDAAQRKRGRPSKENYSQVGNNFGTRTSSDELAEKVGESKNQIFRYVRLNSLVPDLQKKVDDGSLKFNPAVELSYLSPTEQNDFLDYIESQSCSPSLSQAQKLKAASKDGTLDHGKLLHQKPQCTTPRPYADHQRQQKAKFGRSDGHGGLSAVSLRQHKNVLNQTLKLAQRDGLIQTNPADLVVMPHAAQFTGTFYTEAQMRDLLTAVKNERLYPIIYVTALYGLRRSEVLGLKWDSINFAMQTLTIRHTVARVTKVVEKNKTKNASSFRSFPPDRRCSAAVQNPVTAGAILPQPLRQGLHRQRLCVHLGGRASLLT